MLLGQVKDSDEYLLLLPTVENGMGFSLASKKNQFEANGVDFTLLGHDNNPHGPIGGNTIAMLISAGNDPFRLISGSMEILKDRIRNISAFSIDENVQISSNNDKGLDTNRHYERGPGPAFVDNIGKPGVHTYRRHDNSITDKL